MKNNQLDEASAARQSVSSPIVSSPPYSPSTPYQNSTTALPGIPSKAGPAPIIRTLKADLFTTINGVETFTPCVINSREATPFETEFFKGVAMLIVRCDPQDDYYKTFFMGRRMFEVQVQGRFKMHPAGEIFVGAEATKKMELGIITRSISKAAMQFAGTVVNDLNYSFGTIGEDFEVPHVVAPIFPTFDKVIVTPPGASPPPMGIPFVEDLDYRKQRLKFKLTGDANVDLESIYSFSVNTSNLDLLKWNLVNVPLVRPIHLSTFFGNASIQLVGYEIPASKVSIYPNSHPQRFLRYMFKLRLTQVDEKTVVDLPIIGTSDDEVEEDAAAPQMDEMTPSASAMGSAAAPINSVVSSSSSSSFATSGGGIDGVGSRDLADGDGDIVEDDGPEKDALEVDGEDAASQTKFSSTVKRKLFSRPVFLGGGGGGGGTGGEKKGVSGWIRRHISGAKDGEKGGADRSSIKDREKEFTDLTGEGAGEVTEYGEYATTDYDMEAFGDLCYCPASIELNDIRRDHRRRVFYVFPISELYKLQHSNEGGRGDPMSCDVNPSIPFIRFRTYTEIVKAMALLPVPRLHKNKRLSDDEIRRRQIVESYRYLLKQNNAAAIMKLWQMLGPVTEIDCAFFGIADYLLPENRSSLSAATAATASHLISAAAGTVAYVSSASVATVIDISKGKSNTHSRSLPVSDSFEGTVIMATSRRHWAEYFLVISNSEIQLLKGADSRRVVHCIQLSSVLSVKPMSPEESPIPECAFFQLETFPRIYYFMVHSVSVRNQWLEAFTKFLGRAIYNSPFDKQFEGNSLTADITEVDYLYLAKSACWKLDKKRIFNYRRIIFNPVYLPEQYKNIGPSELIESILSAASHLSMQGQEKSSNQIWVKYLDEISLLQTINLSKLAEKERAACMLNLYHAMVLHGCVVIGPPAAWNTWNYFFNNITYLVSYEVVSIAEVEYNIIRAQMSRPSSLSMIVVPNHQFPGLALTHRDFRFNFCINNGSKSMPSRVPIYKAETLDLQLDETTALMLRDSVELDSVKKTAVVPKVSLADFSISLSSANGKGNSNSGGSNVDFLRAISYYLKREDKLLLTRMLSEQSSITVRFKNLSFRCRLFSITAAHTYTPSCAIVTSIATTTNSMSGSSGGATSGATATTTTTNTAATTTTTHILLDNGTPSAIDCVVDIGS